MRHCIDFVEKYALIFYQIDYSLMRLLSPNTKSFGDLKATK